MLDTSKIDQKLSGFTDEEIDILIELIRVDRPLSIAMKIQKRLSAEYFIYIALLCAGLIVSILGLFEVLSRTVAICSCLFSCLFSFLTIRKRSQRDANDLFIYRKVDYICDYLRTHSPYRGVRKKEVS